MSELLILGKGRSRSSAAPLMARSKPPVLWTLNDVVDPRAELHCDIHQDQRFWHLYDQIPCRWLVSPFASVADVEPRMKTFPLLECLKVFGSAYFECTLDYMLALALLQQKRRTVRWDRIHLPGFDMNDGRHYTFRPGASFWIGVARGMGIEVSLPKGSYLLKRVVDFPPQPHGDPEFPHAYGQLPSSTLEVAGIYGWS